MSLSDHPNNVEERDHSTSFEDGVTAILMSTEELRRRCLLSQQLSDTTSSGMIQHGAAATAAVVDQELVLQWREELDDILHSMTILHRLTLDAAPDDLVRHDLYRHCHQRATQLVSDVFHATTSRRSRNSISPDSSKEVADFELDGQAAVARMVEIYIMLQQHLRPVDYPSRGGDNDDNQHATATTTSSIDQMIHAYVAYQRQILRQRAKPALAHLADLRKRRAQQQQQLLQQQQQLRSNGGFQPKVLVEEDHDDDNNDNETRQRVGDQPHAHAMTVILGAAIALIHPLSQWKDHLPSPTNDDTLSSPLYKLCNYTIRVLHDQAESLTKTVSDWFWEDRQVDSDWMSKTAQQQQDTNHGHGNHLYGTESQQQGGVSDLGKLDGLVDEMAFACQVLARYQALIAPEMTTTPTMMEQEIIPEWTWKYATLERYLASQHWQSALEQASPVTIVMGTLIQVPSVVEDAQFLSTRALERAASTQCLQAMGTVAHSISNDIWSSDIDGGVYAALVQQRGCWNESNGVAAAAAAAAAVTPAHEQRVQAPASNGFASALLSALDEDLTSNTTTTTAADVSSNNGKAAAAARKQSSSAHSSAPSSGGFLGLGSLASSLGVVAGDRQAMLRRMTIQLCALNGIHSAITACETLVQLIDSLLAPDGDEDDDEEDEEVDPAQKSSLSMIQLAREELSRFGVAYQRLLVDNVQAAIEEWCGTPVANVIGFTRNDLCIEVLRDFFERERYDLDNTEFPQFESDERLQTQLLTPLRESRLLQQLDRCDAEVVLKLCESICASLAAMIISCLFDQQKRVTDWGSLLLSKQVRILRNYMSQLPTLMAAAEHFPKASASLQGTWERVSQIVTVLQLEKPADWSAYQSSSILDLTDLKSALQLRVDFSQEAIAAVLASIASSDKGVTKPALT